MGREGELVGRDGGKGREGWREGTEGREKRLVGNEGGRKSVGRGRVRESWRKEIKVRERVWRKGGKRIYTYTQIKRKKESHTYKDTYKQTEKTFYKDREVTLSRKWRHVI